MFAFFITRKIKNYDDLLANGLASIRASINNPVRILGRHRRVIAYQIQEAAADAIALMALEAQ